MAINSGTFTPFTVFFILCMFAYASLYLEIYFDELPEYRRNYNFSRDKDICLNEEKMFLYWDKLQSCRDSSDYVEIGLKKVALKKLNKRIRDCIYVRNIGDTARASVCMIGLYLVSSVISFLIGSVAFPERPEDGATRKPALLRQKSDEDPLSYRREEEEEHNNAHTVYQRRNRQLILRNAEYDD